MDGQPPAVHVVGFLAQEIEQLGVAHGDQEVKAVIGIAHNEEQRRFLISDSIKLHFVIHHQVTQLLDVKGCKPCAAGDQYTLGGFSSNKMSIIF